MNEVYKEQNLKVKKILTKVRFILIEKKQSDLLSFDEEFSQNYKQIWVKESECRLNKK